MTVQDALKLIELGVAVVAQAEPGVAPAADIVETFADLISQQVAAYQSMTGKTIDEVIDVLQSINPDPTATDPTVPASPTVSSPNS